MEQRRGVPVEGLTQSCGAGNPSVSGQVREGERPVRRWEVSARRCFGGMWPPWQWEGLGFEEGHMVQPRASRTGEASQREARPGSGQTGASGPP